MACTTACVKTSGSCLSSIPDGCSTVASRPGSSVGCCSILTSVVGSRSTLGRIKRSSGRLRGAYTRIPRSIKARGS